MLASLRGQNKKGTGNIARLHFFPLRESIYPYSGPNFFSYMLCCFEKGHFTSPGFLLHDTKEQRWRQEARVEQKRETQMLNNVPLGIYNPRTPETWANSQEAVISPRLSAGKLSTLKSQANL